MNPPRILIVEDELIVAKDIERKLSKAGYDVEDMVPTGEEAVRKSLVCNPDLVLMDIRLRGPMDGIEAARRILSQADIPIIYLTAHTDEETVQRARGTDPFGYIIKPVESRNLTISIEMALYKHETQKEMRRQLQWLTAMRVIDQTILTHQDIQTTLAEVIQQIAIHLQADAAAILLLQPYSQTLEYTVGCGFHNAAFKSTHFQLGAGNAGNIAKRGRPVHIRDLRAIGEQDILPWMATEEFITYFGVPLICKGQVKGVLEIFQRRPFEPDSHWQNLLEALSDQAAIAVDNLSMLESLRSLNLDLAQAYNATIEGWSSALELRDLETEGHSQRVTETTIKLAIEMGVDVKQMEHIRRGALLHDIGKMGIPDHILLKPGVLTEQERDIMHKHPQYACEMLKNIPFLQPALAIPHYHHERWDGSGYPEGLFGESIPLPARIFAIVDVWDAMLTDRPYRKALREEKALEYIQDESGKHFDPAVVEAFMKLYKKGAFIT